MVRVDPRSRVIPASSVASVRLVTDPGAPGHAASHLCLPDSDATASDTASDLPIDTLHAT